MNADLVVVSVLALDSPTCRRRSRSTTRADPRTPAGMGLSRRGRREAEAAEAEADEPEAEADEPEAVEAPHRRVVASASRHATGPA